MTLELTNEQVSALKVAIDARIIVIENLLENFKISKVNETSKYLIEVYSKELKSINEIGLIIK
jgi:hypothetical protein